MDEATANIDEQTDKTVQDLISKEFRETTVVTIAHRLNTIINYDNLVVIKDGGIEEFGTPEELLEKKHGYFRGIVMENGVEYYEELKSLIKN